MSGHIFIISRLVKPESEQRLGMLKFCLELLKKKLSKWETLSGILGTSCHNMKEPFGGNDFRVSKQHFLLQDYILC